MSSRDLDRSIDVINWRLSRPNILNQHLRQQNPPNRCWPWTKYHQQALVLSQSFIPTAAASSPVPWMVSPGQSLDQIFTTDVKASPISVRLRTPCSPDEDTITNFLYSSPFIWLIECSYSFNYRVTCALSFNVKITAVRCSYRLIMVLWLTQRINPRWNCLYTTFLS